MRYLAIVLACALAAGTADAGTRHPFTHDNPNLRVRPTDTVARKTLDEGLTRSATFRNLVARLEASDVIVYVEFRPSMPSDVRGMLEFMAKRANDRYLRITIGVPQHQSVLVALLGHELQHAAEVADAPGVTTAEEFRSLYRRIGVASGAARYDSVAARLAGQMVDAELRGRDSRDTRVARHQRGDELGDGGSIAMP